LKAKTPSALDGIKPTTLPAISSTSNTATEEDINQDIVYDDGMSHLYRETIPQRVSNLMEDEIQQQRS